MITFIIINNLLLPLSNESFSLVCVSDKCLKEEDIYKYLYVKTGTDES